MDEKKHLLEDINSSLPLSGKTARCQSRLPKMGADFQDEEDNDEERLNFKKKIIGDNSGESSKPISDTPVIDNFGVDLTRSAEDGQLDPIIGRESEIDRLSQILSRRKKNNPVLIGEPGVGKSAIVEGLAFRIIHRMVPRVLFNKKIINLDMVSVVAGTKYRGQFEERIKAILNELSKNPRIILFIDEIHTIIGTGSATGTMDAANMLKPALVKGQIQCIGATTLDEYRIIEKDGALDRRFQKIIVEPTTLDETRLILEKIKHQYEDYHNVTYTNEALDMCVKLTNRYINDRNFPDKAIDAMDEAGSKTHISTIVVPKRVETLECNIRKLKECKLKAIRSQNFEMAADFRDKERHLVTELEIEQIKWDKELKENKQTVDADKVIEMVSVMTGIPLNKITQSESQKLINMESFLKTCVVGQDEAVQKVVKSIQRNRVGLKDLNRPIGTFMFLGPTGVGKTHLVKKMAEYLFDSTDALIRVDMSEFVEKFTVSRLIGAPPGYVGYEEGGQLTEKVRRKPYAVVLLDEIEKAHADIFSLLLQVMDEGFLTDNSGRKIDFKNTIIIMTSNVGSRQLKDFGKSVGFNINSLTEVKSYEQSIIRKSLEKKFSPEFLNRVDDIILFDSLNKQAICQIADIELKNFYQKVEYLGYSVSLSDSVKDFVASMSYTQKLGARPLKRVIRQYLENKLSEMIILSEIKKGDMLNIDLNKDQQKIDITIQ